MQGFLESRYVEKTSFDIVYINLWKDEYTLTEAIGGVYKNCTHKVILDNVCKQCKGYVGYISEEYSDIEYYEHIRHLSTKIKANQIFINTDRFYPDDYIGAIFQKTLTYFKLNRNYYSKTYHLLEGPPTSFYAKNNKNNKRDLRYLVHFSKQKKGLWVDSYYYLGNIKADMLFKSNNNTFNKKSIVINPFYDELVLSSNVLNIICNKKIYNLLNKG